MKILVEDGERNLAISLPTALLFSSGSAWLLQNTGLKLAGLDKKNIPPQAMKLIFAELRKLKKEKGSWELVNVETADGRQIKILL